MGDFSGSPPTILAGYVPSGDDWSTILAELSALSGTWSDWTPTLTNLTVGSTALVSKYRRVGKTVDFEFIFTFSAGAAVSGTPTFTLPVAPSTDYQTSSGSLLPGHIAYIVDGGTTQRQALAGWNGTNVQVLYYNAGVPAGINATTPWTWASTDQIVVTGTYRTA